MRHARKALAHNPLQDSLIPGIHEPAALFGETASTADQTRLAGQYERVKSFVSDGNWHTIPQLSAALLKRFGQRYSETSISARLRQMRQRGWRIESERTRPGSGLFQYRASMVTAAPFEAEAEIEAEAHQAAGETAAHMHGAWG